MAMSKTDLKTGILKKLPWKGESHPTSYLDEFVTAIANAVVDEVLKAEITGTNSTGGTVSGKVVR